MHQDRRPQGRMVIGRGSPGRIMHRLLFCHCLLATLCVSRGHAEAAADDAPQRPLILDSVVAGRVNRLIGQKGRLRSGSWTTRDYAFYLALMDQLARTLKDLHPDEPWTADAAELALFTQ